LLARYILDRKTHCRNYELPKAHGKRMANKALAGIKVLEYCEMVAGPYCTKLLADMGAEVIKIEKPGSGDEARKREPFLNDIPHSEKSGLFLYLNTNKLGITLKVDSAGGKRVFRELASNVSILVHDQSVQTMEGMGLSYESVSRLNPGLIVTSITPFGQTGPYREYRAYPLNTMHGGGEGYLTPGGSTAPDRPPLKVGKYVGEYESGVNAAVATLLAFYHYLGTGLGQHVDISKQESLIVLNPHDLPFWPNLGVVSTRFTRAYRFAGVIPCKDGYVEYTPNRPEEWDTLVDMMGNPEWTRDEKLRDRAYREEHGEELKRKIASSLKDRTKEELYREARKKRCPLVPYFGIDEVVESVQLKAREFFVEVHHPQAGKQKYPSAPYRFSKTRWAVDHPAPLLGEHNEEVYSRYLHCTRHDLIKMREAGII